MILSAWRATALVWIFATLCSGAFAADTTPSPWSRFFTLRSGLGYKDNVLLSSANEQGSAFAINAADVMILRYSDTGPQVTLFVTAEDFRYFSGDAVEDEQTVITSADISQKIGENWKIGSAWLYLYQNLVFDASSTTTNRAVQVRGHNFTLRPYIVRYLPHDLRLEARLTGSRQYLAEPLDDYWEGGPRLLVAWQFARRSEVSLSYEYRLRSYDSRRELTATGLSTLESLWLEQQEVELGLTYHFDEARRWRSATRAAYERNDDLGPGYFTYDKYRLSQSLRYNGASWQAMATAKVLRYVYDLQPVTFGGEARRRTIWSASLELDKELSEKWNLFLDFQHEQTLANDPFDEYKLSSVMGGAEFNF